MNHDVWPSLESVAAAPSCRHVTASRPRRAVTHRSCSIGMELAREEKTYDRAWLPSCAPTCVCGHRRAARRSTRKKSWNCCIDICRGSNSGSASKPWWRRSPPCATTWTRSAGRPNVSGRAARVRLMRSPSTSPVCTATCKGSFRPCRRSRSSSSLERTGSSIKSHYWRLNRAVSGGTPGFCVPRTWKQTTAETIAT